MRQFYGKQNFKNCFRFEFLLEDIGLDPPIETQCKDYQN